MVNHFSPALHKAMYLQTSTKLIDISILKKTLPHDLSSSLLFIHAMSGCDSTSRPYGIGKVSTMDKYQSIQRSARIFMMPNRMHKEIEKAGNEPLAIIYGCKPGMDLNFERASRFSEKVVSSSCCLPPQPLPTNFRYCQIPQL